MPRIGGFQTHVFHTMLADVQQALLLVLVGKWRMVPTVDLMLPQPDLLDIFDLRTNTLCAIRRMRGWPLRWVCNLCARLGRPVRTMSHARNRSNPSRERERIHNLDRYALVYTRHSAGALAALVSFRRGYSSNHSIVHWSSPFVRHWHCPTNDSPVSTGHSDDRLERAMSASTETASAHVQLR